MPDISSMTQGVDPTKVQGVIDDIKTKLCVTAVEQLRDNMPIKNKLRGAWTGADCEKFIENFDAAIENACSALDGYRTAIEAALNDISTQWSEFQQGNVS